MKYYSVRLLRTELFPELIEILRKKLLRFFEKSRDPIFQSEKS
ncbi:Uncharacterized protein dnm_073440 [Desulfonema magnum]|uniref:Uncharacterized protein n=1 Tax=Desulfonema magnum TaxID=45655 RepID=A0A975BTB8_9BACT|nr:Uncharacterized protein dnm_073440 [Desulfonema magnum]